MELGIYTFGEIFPDPRTGQAVSTTDRLEGVIALAKLADEAGLDVVTVGEHHGRDFSISAPEIMLAAIARETKNVRLSTGVTILSTQDPVRVFQQLATVDQLSGGRAEIIAGRGAFTESFPLFGYTLDDYDALFDEKLRLLLAIREDNPLTWSGRFRSAIGGLHIGPRPLQQRLPVWVGSGGSPGSVARAGVLGLPLYLGFFNHPGAHRQLIDVYRAAAARAGHDASTLRVGTGNHMYISKTSQGARDQYYPYYAAYWQQLPHFKGGGFPRSLYDQWTSAAGGLVVGSPAEVTDNILNHYQLLGSSRFIGQIDVGSLPLAMSMSSLELFATEVAPVIRRETAAATAGGPAAGHR
jgi:alkanesulfonate monooxygenase SsuD/methylene tetrahydromethanopterin reductase-like flavin-dependent oxidoreductase (luciferase family)